MLGERRMKINYLFVFVKCRFLCLLEGCLKEIQTIKQNQTNENMDILVYDMIKIIMKCLYIKYLLRDLSHAN